MRGPFAELKAQTAALEAEYVQLSIGIRAKNLRLK